MGLAGLLGLGLCSGPAAAWDPSTTHQGLLESAVTRSAVHLRWMDASELERGLFTSLRVDPDRLTKEELRLLQLTIRNAHADVGARPLGGPGACPSADAPPETQLFCVDQNLWEHSALGWLRLGMLAEVTPSARELNHFVDLEHPEAARWSDDELPAAVLRRRARANGEPTAGVVTGTNFSGQAPSAIAWFEDPDDLLAPPQTYAHLALASSAASQAERDHHLALAMMGVGALLHVVQDLAVPAHARGDGTAFFAPLSPAPGDRGLPLQEFVRFEYGRSELPGLRAGLGGRSSALGSPAPGGPSAAGPSGVPLAETLIGHVLGDAQHDGVATLAGRHFFSESSVPAPQHLDPTLSASEAASALLGDAHHLAAVEVEGATLAPWPAERGYLLSPTGRALAAFDTDLDGRTRPYLDEACYRDQAALLLPAAVDATRSLLDLLWPAWPEMQRSGDDLVLTIPAWASAELSVSIQRDDGQRREVGRHALTVSSENVVALGVGELAPGERVVLVLDATRADGPPIVLEQILSRRGPA
ncbi:hypothetical protein, partial [Enhygromyxa salina]|uniref:hypothetical protein n=1 Tax=Enhygromyxa salina TaxID=215803 RepID=UPI0011B254CA